MRVLIACEESQVVCKAFRERGHEAYSCDLLPCSGGHPEWHIQGDIVEVLNRYTDKYFDLIIIHIPCTKVAVSGNRWYGVGMPRHSERLEYIKWAVEVWELVKRKSKKCALLFYIQPWMFGHGETKKTGLAVCGLSELEATNIVEGREQRIWKMGPSPDRAKERSKTYEGIAHAMAAQWG